MKRIRRRVIILMMWLVGFYSLDKLLEPNDISEITYLFMVGVMALVLSTPRLTLVQFWMLLITPLLLSIPLNIWIAPPSESTSILLLIFETAGILITTLLSYRVSLAVNEFELAVAHISVDRRERITEDPSQGAGTMYREVRRSRNHDRPLALLAVAIDDTSLKLQVDRIVQEAQQAMMKQYALTAVGRLLCDRLEDCDTIVQNNEHFLVLLPETCPEDLPGLIERLRQQSTEQIGVELKIGAASLPEDGFTLEGLVEQATRGIKTVLAPEFIPELKDVPVNKQTHWSWLTAHTGTHDGSGTH